MKAFIFPGQGSQFVGMGKALYEHSSQSKALFELANKVLGFDITKVMIDGTADELKQTSITQPAVFLHSVIHAKISSSFTPDVVAGHSLGEFSALVSAGSLEFHEGLTLVYKRAMAMQAACDKEPSSMAAIIGLDNEVIEQICGDIDALVVPANYNCPGQLVISGSVEGIQLAVDKLKEAGARRALVLPVNGAFHSPFMEPARLALKDAIEATEIVKPTCPIYQNVTGLPYTDPTQIKENLINQLTAPVKWTQTMLKMVEDGVQRFVEVGGNGKTLSGFVKRVNKDMPTEALV